MATEESLEETARLARCAAAWAVASRVPVGRRRIRYRSAGEGEPIVLVHGLSMSADYWVRNAPYIAAAGHHVLAPDLPGFGRTEGPERGLSISRQAAALDRWMDALALPPAVLVGHSLSCQAVLELTAARPERVRGLVLVAPTGDRKRALPLRQAIGLARDAIREPAMLLALALQAYLRAGPSRFLRTWWIGTKHDPLSRLPAVRCPGLVLIGTRDPVVDPEFAREVAEGLGDGQLRMIEGGTHGLILSTPAEFNRAVVEFLDGLPRHSGAGRNPG